VLPGNIILSGGCSKISGFSERLNYSLNNEGYLDTDIMNYGESKVKIMQAETENCESTHKGL